MPASKPSAPPVTSQLDISQGNATAALYGATIGPISSDYYLPIFTRFESAPPWRMAWNWAACLYTVNWMIFRGLGRAALVYGAAVAGAAVLFGLGRMIFQWSSDAELALLAVLALLVFGVPGLLGNRWLYSASRQKMGDALRESDTLAEACTLLARQASSRQRFLKLVTVNVVAVAVTVGFYGWNTLQTDQMASAQESAAPPETGAPSLRPPDTASSSAALPVPVPALQGAASPAVASPVQSGPVTDVVAARPEPVPEATSPAEIAPPLTTQPVQAPDLAPTHQVKSAAPANPPELASPSSASNLSSAVPPERRAAQKSLVASAKPAPSAPPVRQRFYINVGLFAKDANAQNALDKLERANLPTLSSTVRTPKGDRTRVRAGPYKSQREAEAAAATIRGLNLDAVVVKLSI